MNHDDSSLVFAFAEFGRKTYPNNPVEKMRISAKISWIMLTSSGWRCYVVYEKMRITANISRGDIMCRWLFTMIGWRLLHRSDFSENYDQVLTDNKWWYSCMATEVFMDDSKKLFKIILILVVIVLVYVGGCFGYKPKSFSRISGTKRSVKKTRTQW